MLLAPLIGSLHLTACGPETVEHGDWMLGTFTQDWEEKIVLGTTTRYIIEEEGVFEVVDVRGCSEHREELVGEYSWRAVADDTIEVNANGTVDGAPDGYRIRETEDCNVLSMEMIFGEEVISTEPLRRGVMCMQDLSPCEGGFECDSCMTVWCDGSPPSCEEE